MGSREDSQHAIDHPVHPVGGWFVLVWGLLVIAGPVPRGPAPDAQRFSVDILMGVGILLLGLALLIPKGPARTWLVGAWLGSIGAWLAFVLYALMV